MSAIDLRAGEMYYVREYVAKVFDRKFKTHCLQPEVEVTGCLHVLEYTKEHEYHPQFKRFQFAFLQRNQAGRWRRVIVLFERSGGWTRPKTTKTIDAGPWLDAPPELLA